MKIVFSLLFFLSTIQNYCKKCYLVLQNIHLEGSMSQNFDLGLTFYSRLSLYLIYQPR